MLVVMVRIPVVSPEQGEQIVERFRNRAGLVDSYQGFLGFELLRGEGECISVTRWASREDLDRWMNSQANAQAHVNTPGHTQSGQGGHGGTGQSAQVGQGAQGRGGAGMPGGVTIYEVVIPAGEQG